MEGELVEYADADASRMIGEGSLRLANRWPDVYQENPLHEHADFWRSIRGGSS